MDPQHSSWHQRSSLRGCHGHHSLSGKVHVWCDPAMFMLPNVFPQFTISGISELIQVLCMILKMNISATFVVAYIQVQEYIPICVCVVFQFHTPHTAQHEKNMFSLFSICFHLILLQNRPWRCSQPQCANLESASVRSSLRWSVLGDPMRWLLEQSMSW